MKLTLKNVKHSKSLSQGTPAFTADVLVDGVKRGTVRNSGQGGPHEVHPHTLVTEIEAYAKTLPPIRCWGLTVDASYETVIDSALTTALEGKRLQRMMKTKVVFLKGGKCFTSGARPADAETVLNDIPFEDAVARFVEATTALP